MPDRIKRVSRVLGYCVWLGDQGAWWGLVTVLRARLTVSERVSLAFMALKSLNHDDALMTAESALGGAGMPEPTLFSPMRDAGWWAERATPDELKAYMLASFDRLALKDQAAFLEFVSGRAAA